MVGIISHTITQYTRLYTVTTENINHLNGPAIGGPHIAVVVPARDIVKCRAVRRRVRGKLVQSRIRQPLSFRPTLLLIDQRNHSGKYRRCKAGAARHSQVIATRSRIPEATVTTCRLGRPRRTCSYPIGLVACAEKVSRQVWRRIQRNVRHISLSIVRNSRHAFLPARFCKQSTGATA